MSKAWKLVPVEPTLEMKEAGGVYRDQCRATGVQRTCGGYYRAMVAVAPASEPIKELSEALATALALCGMTDPTDRDEYRLACETLDKYSPSETAEPHKGD